MAEEKRIQVNIPLSAEERAAVNEAAKARGISQAEFLRQAAQAAMLENLAEAVPQQGDAISEFRAMIDRLMTCYQSALEQSRDAYEQASAKVRGQLEALGTLTTDNKRLTEENKDLSLALAAAQEENKLLKAELSAAQAKAAEADDLRKQLTEAREQAVTMREQHQEAIAQERRDSREELMAALATLIRENK